MFNGAVGDDVARVQNHGVVFRQNHARDGATDGILDFLFERIGVILGFFIVRCSGQFGDFFFDCAEHVRRRFFHLRQRVLSGHARGAKSGGSDHFAFFAVRVGAIQNRLRDDLAWSNQNRAVGRHNFAARRFANGGVFQTVARLFAVFAHFRLRARNARHRSGCDKLAQNARFDGTVGVFRSDGFSLANQNFAVHNVAGRVDIGGCCGRCALKFSDGLSALDGNCRFGLAAFNNARVQFAKRAVVNRSSNGRGFARRLNCSRFGWANDDLGRFVFHFERACCRG